MLNNKHQSKQANFHKKCTIKWMNPWLNQSQNYPHKLKVETFAVLIKTSDLTAKCIMLKMKNKKHDHKQVVYKFTLIYNLFLSNK